MQIFRTAEESYFSNWTAEPFARMRGTPVPGEFMLTGNLFGVSPGPAAYLKEPMLDANGRKEYRKGLRSILAELPKLQGNCDDGGRTEKIGSCATIALAMLNTVCYCLVEPT